MRALTRDLKKWKKWMQDSNPFTPEKANVKRRKRKKQFKGQEHKCGINNLISLIK